MQQVAPVECPWEVAVADRECTMLIAPIECVPMSNSTSEEYPKVEVDNPELKKIVWLLRLQRSLRSKF